MRDLRGSPRTLAAAAATLEALADRTNALQARLIAVRRLLLLGRLDEAASALARLDARFLPPSLLAVAELAAAEVALRSLRTAPAQAALARAHDAAKRAGVPALLAEVADARAVLDRPLPDASTPATGNRCASARSKHSSPRTRWCSTPAVAACAPAPPGCPWRDARPVRIGPRARRGLARRRRSARLDRARVPNPPPQ
jgi:hypothetical protein